MLCSASTIERRLSSIGPDGFNEILRRNALYMRERGLWKGIKSKVVMNLDGSCFGRMSATCMEIAGEAHAMPRCRNDGKECVVQ